MRSLLVLGLLLAPQDRDMRADLKDLEMAGSDPDVQVFAKGVTWALRGEPKLPPKDAALVRKALDRGLRRTEDKERCWTKKKWK